MNNPSSIASGCQFAQSMVNQGPRFDNQIRKRKRRKNQVVGKSGLIRPDKRYKARYL